MTVMGPFSPSPRNHGEWGGVRGLLRQPRARVLLFGALALAAGCSKAGRPHVERITVDTYTGEDVLGLTPEQLASKLTARLDQARFVVLAPKAKAPDGVVPWKVSFAVEVDEPDPEVGAQGSVAAVLELNRAGKDGPEGFDVKTSSTRPAKSNKVEDLQEAANEAFDIALGHAVGEARALLELRRLEGRKLAAQLGAEVDTRNAAVRLLAERKDPAALQPLVDRLASGDTRELRTVMGLLVQLGDPRGVGPLIEASRGKDNVVQRELVFALGAIGGEEAEAYLYTVSQGHDDPLIRSSAEQALEELKARREGTLLKPGVKK